MGTYLNPGNSGFAEIVRSDYVDKTGLIGHINRTIGTTDNLTCISRPRRFGKSFAAQALCAYYDRTCDSRELFEGLEVSRDETYEGHLNAYDVIYLDVAGVKPYTKDYAELVPFLIGSISHEIVAQYPDVAVGEDLAATLASLVEHTGGKVVAIVDEWDAPIRECPETGRAYLRFLRSLFKNSGVTPKVFACAYMTGILPIKRGGSRSAMSGFREYTMLDPGPFAPYVGFTEAEVRRLCEENQVSFGEMRRWYDGYGLRGAGALYCPHSVMEAIDNGELDAYWTETSAAEVLMGYISRGYGGLTGAVAELVGGVDVHVDARGLSNDLVTLRGADDVLTLLVHLGHLAYDQESGCARIPNGEVGLEFQRAIRLVPHEETHARLRESEALFLDTAFGDETAVAAQIERVHREETSPIHYNREDSLRDAIKLAYYTYRDHYLMWEELPSGVGYADVAYLPRPGSAWPALVVELGWGEVADGAVAQILAGRCPESLKGLGCDIVLVTVSCDRGRPAGERRFTCKIERLASRER